jgi:hypothetical protein
MVLNATPEEQAQYRALNRLRMKAYRDKTRKHKYTPRNVGCVQSDIPKEEKHNE